MDSSTQLTELLKDGLSSRYRIERELGRGGMAVVFLARDLAHERPVAIKALLPEIAAGVSTERFLREIRLLATLQHPNILPLYDSGQVRGIPYYVMPFVAGESLRDRLTRDGDVPINLAVRMASEAAAALDYAHRQGIVHRDVKPENILLSDEHVIMADFGIARAAAQSADDRITSTSVTIGTPAYMSPEQASGDVNIDGRSDIYSLGCVLFEMISGKSPFAGSTPASVIASRFAHAAPRISSVMPGVPGAVDVALSSALSLSPDDRPQSAAEFAALLSGESHVRQKTSRIPRIGIFAAMLLVLVGLATAYLSRRPEDSAVAQLPSSKGGSPRKGGTSDSKAHELYLEGKKTLQVPSLEATTKAADSFRAAIARDSLYAEAWAGLADTHSSLGVGNYQSVPPRPEFEQARFAATRALELDSSLAEAHTALALVQMMYDYDWKAAARSLDKAQAFDPGYGTTYLYRSFLFTFLGKFDSATALAREALHMDPNDFRFRQDVGRTLILARRFPEAEKELGISIAMGATNSRLRQLLGDALMADGKFAEAVRELEAAQKISPGTSRITAFRIAAYARAGETKRAQALMDSLVALSDKQFVSGLDLAISYAGLKNTEQTMIWLERSYNDRTLRPFMRDPVFDFIKNDPRYRALLMKMNLGS
ncbi:MAG: protein kinase [Gemmatimonadaceae bacterium]